MAATSDLKIEIKKSFLAKTSGRTSWIGNFSWKTRLFAFDAHFPINTVPGPEHLSLVYMVSNSESREVSLKNCTPDDVQAVTEDERRKSRDAGIKKKTNLFAVHSEEPGKGPRTYYLEALDEDDMKLWLCKLKEYLSKGQLFAVVVEPNQGIESGNVLLTFRDQCLILLCSVTNTVLGVWQLKKLLSFGLNGRTFWFNTEKPRRPKNLEEFKGLTLSDVEDYINLTVDTQHTGPAIVATLKGMIEDCLKRPVGKGFGPGMVFSVKSGRHSSERSQEKPVALALPKEVYIRPAKSVPSSPLLSRKTMTCFESRGDHVTPYHVTNLIASSAPLDDKIARKHVKARRGAQKKISDQRGHTAPKLKRKVSQVYFNTTSQADAARFERRQTVEEINSDYDDDNNSEEEEEAEEEKEQELEQQGEGQELGENKVEEYYTEEREKCHEDQGGREVTPESNSEQQQVLKSSASKRVSTSSSEDYTVMDTVSPYVNVLVKSNSDCVLGQQAATDRHERDSSSSSDDYMNMYAQEEGEGQQETEERNGQETAKVNGENAEQGYVELFQA